MDTLCAADIDFIKDDELIGDPPYAPLEARVKAVMKVVNRHADRMGRKVMVAFNISDDADAMHRHHDLVVKEGGTCVMASVNWTGPAAITALRRHATVPIHRHRNGFGMMNRAPSLGMDYRVYQKLWRLAGVDQLHVNGFRSKFWEPDDSVAASALACMQPFAGMRPIMPVFSSGQTRLGPSAYADLDPDRAGCRDARPLILRIRKGELHERPARARGPQQRTGPITMIVSHRVV